MTACWVEIYDQAVAIAATGAHLFGVATGSAGSVFHLNNTLSSMDSEASFSGSTTAPGCASGATYLVEAVASFTNQVCPYGEHDNSISSGLPADIDTGLQTVHANSCDFTFANGSTACSVPSQAGAYVTCAPHIIASKLPDPNGCLSSNVVPLSYNVWEGGNVGVYIDSTVWTHTSSQYAAICAGIQTWGPVDGKTYTCYSYAGPPPSTTTAPYVFVTNTTGIPNWCSQGCITTNGTSVDQRGPKQSGADQQVQVATMHLVTGLTPVTNYTGVAAHENGHLHHFTNCPPYGWNQPAVGCSTSGSLMGPQPTNNLAGTTIYGITYPAGDQPQAPTTCDKWAWNWYSNL